MPQIHILPVDVRNKIAAGEVIERPASVVKELIENSIDAAATDITVEILRGGKQLIRVTDNGNGMDRDDALLCLERHATSKLQSEEDLFNIKTMGFRGEALPSIASVSKMRVVSGLKNALSGTAIEVHGGEVKEIKEYPSPGTSIEVRDLFFNTPARKKFLKSDSTELLHIIDAVTKEALARWEIRFRLFTERQETINLPSAHEPGERIAHVYGIEFRKGLSEISAERHGMRMQAFFTKGDTFRNSRSHQYIFVNRRPVKDPAVSHAVYKAFEGILPSDKHPVFFIFLDIDPREVDFNVHPTKREVRFEHKDDIHRFVMGSVMEAVRKARTEFTAPFSEAPEALPQGHDYPLHAGVSPSPDYSIPSGPAGAVAEHAEFTYQPVLPFLYLGDTFIAASGKGGLTLIDHHAAHERILYEKLLKGAALHSHTLLFPAQVKLSHKEYRVLLEQGEMLMSLGIELNDFGHDTVIVRSLPAELKEADLQGILSDIAAVLIDGSAPLQSLKEALAAKIACHSSVRGKVILHQEEFQKLLNDLNKTEHPDQCPHGRPTRLFFTLDDLKKLFKRK